jgi:hypothetical protein
MKAATYIHKLTCIGVSVCELLRVGILYVFFNPPRIQLLEFVLDYSP